MPTGIRMSRCGQWRPWRTERRSWIRTGKNRNSIMKTLTWWMAAVFALGATAFGGTGTEADPFAKPDTRAVNADGMDTTGVFRRIADGGFDRDFEVALDELSVPVRGGRQVSRSVSKAGSLAEIRRRAIQWNQDTGEDVELVLYEAGKKRTPYSRRVLTKQVLVQAEAGMDLREAAVQAGGNIPVKVDYAPGFYLVETDEIGGALDLAEQLRGQPGVLGADPVLARLRQKKWVPNDTLFSQQWHLLNTGQGGGTAGIDVRITNVWDTYRGSNILIGIVDDGLQITHTDLFENVNTTIDWDWNGGDGDPSPDISYDWHGSSCAGVAAARGNNGRGVSGAAPYATLVGYRLIGGESTDAMEASAMTTNNHLVHLKSNSWGPSDDGTLDGPGALTRAALSNAATTGRSGLGTIIVWAGGNGLEAYDDSNYDGYANSIYTIAVAALTDGGEQSWYSEPGANVVVTSPSSGGATDIITTDLMGNDGYNPDPEYDELADTNYTKTFGGTSSATPLVAGVLALVLEANPDLGWRDVQEILIRSATQNAPSDADWRTNSAGITFNHKYGAGLVNARGAVTLAETWENLGPQVHASVVQTNVNQAIPDNNPAGITQSFTLSTTNLRVEHVTVTFDALHTYRGDLAITLTSPSGMQSRLSEQHNDSGANYSAWTFSSVRHWGEEALGEWTLNVADLGAEDTGTFRWARIDFYGTPLGAVSNQPPAISLDPAGASKTVVFDTLLSFTVTATDYDGGAVALTASNLPAGATAPAANGTGTASTTFNWTPAEGQIGTHTVTFSATDSDGTSQQEVQITVRDGRVAADLFISEYVEGSGSEKFIEIFNGTGTSVDLSNYALQLFSNGSATPSSDVTLSGTLADGAVKVYQNASATVYPGEDNAAVNFNGDDAVALYKISAAAYVDIVGCIGEDPGTEWTDGTRSTLNKTLVRKSTITEGVSANPASGFPTLTTEWDSFPQDTVEYLGSHEFGAAGPEAPSFAAIPPQSASVGVLFSLDVSVYDSGNPAPAVTLESSTADAGDYSFAGGTLSFTPSTAGEFDFVFLASNELGTAMATATVTAVEGPVELLAPVIQAASGVDATQFNANWQASAGATGYILDVATNETFSGGGEPPVGGNLMSNAGFETGDSTDWDKFETEYAVVSTDPQEGSYHVNCAATGTRDLMQAVDITGDGVTEYEVSFWYKKPSEAGNSRIWATWATGGQVSGDNLTPSNYLASVSDWTQATYHVVPQSGVNTLNFEVRTYTGATVSWDNFYVGTSSRGAKAAPYVPGYESLDVGNVTTYAVTGLTEGVTYYYRVKAYNASSNSPYSAVTSVVTQVSSGDQPAITGFE
ncbi:MAG: hypothetical protein EOM10_02180, partial [Opitutae bacterium]|nr:hypothetical protein [Opitutae bacterium]